MCACQVYRAAIFEMSDCGKCCEDPRLYPVPCEVVAETEPCDGRSMTERERIEIGAAVRTVAFDAIMSGFGGPRLLWTKVGETEGRKIIRECVSLIRTIPVEKHPMVVRAIVKTLKGKYDRDELIDEIERIGQGAVDEDGATLIANDQIAKSVQRMQLVVWKSQGWKRVQWRHSHKANEPRKLHVTRWNGKKPDKDGRVNGLDGYVFPIDEPPVIDEKTGERGYPAQLINCTCFLIPVS